MWFLWDGSRQLPGVAGGRRWRLDWLVVTRAHLWRFDACTAADGFCLQIVKLDDDWRNNSHGNLGTFRGKMLLRKKSLMSVVMNRAPSVEMTLLNRSFEVTTLLVLVVTSPG